MHSSSKLSALIEGFPATPASGVHPSCGSRAFAAPPIHPTRASGRSALHRGNQLLQPGNRGHALDLGAGSSQLLH